MSRTLILKYHMLTTTHSTIYPLTQKTHLHPLAVSIDQIPNQKLPFTS
uniref:Uncharacterized protein n=1 Tax=Moniliophthora roreri TaxID=221103 RepID=A0A0W0FE60_MONRR